MFLAFNVPLFEQFGLAAHSRMSSLTGDVSLSVVIGSPWTNIHSSLE